MLDGFMDEICIWYSSCCHPRGHVRSIGKIEKRPVQEVLQSEIDMLSYCQRDKRTEHMFCFKFVDN